VHLASSRVGSDGARRAGFPSGLDRQDDARARYARSLAAPFGSRPTRRRTTALVLAVLAALAIHRSVPGSAKSTDSRPALPNADARHEPSAPGLLVLDDSLEPLSPECARPEADDDHVEALARFSAGRSLEWNRQFAQALRHYQRALRYDPESKAVAESAVRLGVQLDRLDEAVRLAQKVPEAGWLSPVVWMKLGVHLTKKGDFARAATMYENALTARAESPPAAGEVALWLELARLYYLLDEHAKSADCFARVREGFQHPDRFGLDDATRRGLLGDPGVTYGLMGNSFLRAERFDEAVAAFERSHQFQPDAARLHYNRARVAARTGKPAEALDKLQAAFEEGLAGEGVAPYRLLAQVLEDLGKESELVERLEKLRADDAENVPLGYFLAETYHKAEHFDKAEALYRELVAKTPTVTAYRALVGIGRQTGRLEALFDVLGEAAAQGVASGSFGNEGESIADDAELTRALIEIARKRRADAPGSFGFGPALGTALLALEANEFEAANEFFDLTVQADPGRASETLLIWGLGLLAQERYDMAAQVFRRGIDGDVLPDDNPVLHFYLSGALELDGRTDEALAAARKAAELDPKSPRFLSRVAWILYRNDRHEEAAERYARLIEQFDGEFGSAEVRQVLRESRLVLSNLAVLDDDFPKAERWLQEVLDEFPDDVAALNDLGYLWADENVHLERAHRMLRRAVEGDPDNAAYRDSLGWVLHRLGRHEEAVAELEKAAAGDEPDPVILDHLGDAYHAAQQPDKARQAWKRALPLFQEDNDADMVKTIQEKLAENP